MATTVSRPVTYHIEDPEQVDAYIAEHPAVGVSLAAARDVLPRYFDDPTVAVYVLNDPEDDVPPTLRAAVFVQSDLVGAWERLSRFHREWWRTQPIELISKLEFGID